MYSVNTDGLLAEYLFEPPTRNGEVLNTAQPGDWDGILRHAAGDFPLNPHEDIPHGFIGKSSLDFNVLRRVKEKGLQNELKQEWAQFVEIGGFPDPDDLTVEAWVKVDYAITDQEFTDPDPGTYPDGAVGFGACPQPACKAFSWYLFLSTLQTDRNLIFTIIPDAVTQGLPKSEDAESGSGGIVSEDIVHAGQWTHIAATFGKLGSNSYIMHTYINGIYSHVEEVTGFDGTMHRLPNTTDNQLASSIGQPMRLGQFRDIQDNLDYQFSGRMTGVRIYKIALTHEQIWNDFRHDISLNA